MSSKTTTSLVSLPTEVIEQIAFYHVCPRVLGPPVPLTSLLLICKQLYWKLTGGTQAHGARHLFARVFKYKFSFSAIRRRGFEPRAGEWAWQLRRWCEVLRGVRRRRQRNTGQYDNDVIGDEPGVQETMYALWIMCLEDDGCNRLQMQLAGVYEWVEGWIRKEMYQGTDKGWPVANAGNSCAMWVFWYLTTKARLLEESEDQREVLIDLVLPFLTVPFRYPTAFAPAHHFNLPLRAPPSTSASSNTPFSIPTPHGPYPIYLNPSRHTWLTPHFDRWTPLCTPPAADAAKLVYFSRRETLKFSVPDMLPRNRQDHRARVRARLAEIGDVDENEVESVFRTELPRPTQEDFEELNAGLLGGELVGSDTSSASSIPSSSPSFAKGGGTALPYSTDTWDVVRRQQQSQGQSELGFSIPEASLEAAENCLGGEIDESSCSSRRWDPDWWRLRLCRTAWDGETQRRCDGDGDCEVDNDVNVEDAEDDEVEVLDDEAMTRGTPTVPMPAPGAHDTELGVSKESLEDSDTQRSPTMFCGYPQKGSVHNPGMLSGLWTGRMVIPSETHLRALLLPPAPPLQGHADAPQVPVPIDALADNHAIMAQPQLQFPQNNEPPPEPEPEAGQRPTPFTEDTLGLVAVPLYVRLKEHVVYAGGPVLPCANNTTAFDDDDRDGTGTGTEVMIDDGLKDAWFPPESTLSTSSSFSPSSASGVTVSVPPAERYEYVTIDKNFGMDAPDADKISQGKRPPGTYHDRESCPGCLAREDALRTARASMDMDMDPDMALNRDMGENFDTEGAEGEDSDSADLPSYVPSPRTLPSCTGVRDVLLTGTTDVGHAAAWGKWAWQGRVRKWDGLVGLVRSAATVTNVNAHPSSSPAGGKIFFYGTLVGGQNLVGTWRLAHEDPNMPAYEGAFTLGRKDE